MPENKQYYVYVPGEQQGRMVDAATFDTKKDEFFKNYPTAVVNEISQYNPADTDINDNDVYQVQLDGMTSPTSIDSKSFNSRKDEFLKLHPDAKISKVRDYSDAYWRPKLEDAQAALDAFSQEHGDYMRQYENYEMLAKHAEEGEYPNYNSQSHQWLKENGAEYSPLKEQRDALRAAIYNNPIITKGRQQAYDNAMSLREQYLDLASKATSRAERKDYERAAKLQGDAAELYGAPGQYDNNGDKSGFQQYLDDYQKGAGNIFSDRDFWTRGFSQIARDLDLHGIRKKVEEAEKQKGAGLEADDFDRILTPSEKAELVSFYNLATAQADDRIGRANDLSSAYRAGQSAAESLGFMAEFLLSQGLANVAGKAMSASSNGLTRWLGQALMSDKALARAVEKGVTTVPQMSKAAKTGTELARPLVQGLWHTGTQVSTFADMAQMMNQTNDAGELNSIGRGMWLGFVDSLIENWSESLGNTMDKGFDLGLQKLGQMGEKTLGNTSFGRMARWALNSPFNQTLKEAGFNGFFGEMLEEWAGNAVRVVSGMMSKEEFKDFASLQQQLEMAASFAPMSLFGLGGNVISARAGSKGYKQLAEQVKGILLKNGVDQTDIDQLFNTRFDTAEDIASKLAPYAAQVWKNGGESAQQDYKTMLDFAMETGAQSFAEDVKELQNKEHRNEMQGVIEAKTGEQFWQNYDSPETDAEGNPVQVQQVRVVEYADGRRAYIVAGIGNEGAEGRQFATVDENGQHGYINDQQIKQGQEDGTITADRDLPLDEYLQERVDAVEANAEAERMQAEYASQLNAVKQRIASDPHFDMGTPEAPKPATVIPETVTGTGLSVLYTDENGQQVQSPQMSWKDVAEYLGMPLGAKTNAELQEEAAVASQDAIDRKDKYNKIPAGTEIIVNQEGADGMEQVPYRFAKAIYDAEDGIIRIYVANEDGTIATNEKGEEVWFPAEMVEGLDGLAEQSMTPAEQVEDAVKEEVVETEKEPAVTRYTNEEGKVNQTAFMKEEPEEWAKWNDGRRQDGGASTIERINASLTQLSTEINALSTKKESMSNPDDADALEEQLSGLISRRDRLAAILNNYVPATPAVEAQEAQPAQGAAPVAEAPAAAASSEPEKTGYRAMSPREAAEAILLDENFDTTEDALSFIDGFVKRSLKAVQKVQKAVDNVKAEDYVDPKAFKEARAAVEADLPAREEEYNFWLEVKKEAERIVRRRKEELREPKTLRELIANVMGGYLHGLDRADFARELGLGNTEMNKLFPFWAKSGQGLSVQALAEQVAAEDDLGLVPHDSNADQADTQAVRNEIIDFLRESGSVKEIMDYTSNINMEREKQLAEEAAAAEERARIEAEAEAEAEAAATAAEQEQAPVEETPAEETPAETPVEESTPAAEEDDLPFDENDSWRASVAEGEPGPVDLLELAKKETERVKKLRKRVAKWKKFVGDSFEVVSGLSDLQKMDDPSARAALAAMKKGEVVEGWFNTKNGKAYIYLPNVRTSKVLDRKIVHEVLSHKGIRGMLGEERFGQMLDHVWDIMSEADREKYANYPGVNGNKRAAADEYMAHQSELRAEGLAEKTIDADFWTKLGEFVKDFINDALGADVFVSADDLGNMLKDATAYVRRNAPAAKEEGDEETRLSVTDTIDNDMPEGNVLYSIKEKDGKKSLVGLHNISEHKLASAIRTGGLANPSMAVIDVDTMIHEDYGEISLLAPASLIDSETGRNAGTYNGDAWTPTYPGVSKQMSDKGYDKFYDDVRDLPEPINHDARNDWREYLDDDRMGRAIYWWFLQDTGRNPEIIRVQSDLSEEDRAIVHLFDNKRIFEDLEDAQKAIDLYRRLGEPKEVENASHKVEVKKDRGRFTEWLEAKNEDIDTYGIWTVPVQDFIDILRRQLRLEGSVAEHATYDTARKAVEEGGLQNEFDQWLQDKEKKYGVKEVLFAGWTPDGDRKYVANTVENASRLMNKEDDQNAYGNNGIGATRSVLLDRFRTLSEIRKHKDQLKYIRGYASDTDEYKNASDNWFAVIEALANMQKISDNQFSNIDYAESRLQEAIQERNPIAYLNKEYRYNIAKDGEFADALKASIKEIKALPAKYFETKFNRPVYLNEFAAAVVPADTNDAIRKELEKAGVPVYDYDSKQEGSRKEAVLQASQIDGVRFSVSDTEAIKEAAIENGTFMMAPNGKPTNLTETQWLQVQTPAFKKWFGDSKIVDENGEPAVCFHGSSWNPNAEMAGDAVFKDSFRGTGSGDNGFFGRGFYFTYGYGADMAGARRSEANYYGGHITEAFLSIKNPFMFSETLYQYNGKDNYGSEKESVVIVNMVKNFPELVKDYKLTTFDSEGNEAGEISLEEYAKMFDEVYKNKEFIINENIDARYHNIIEVCADPVHFKENYGHGDVEWDDYKFRLQMYRPGAKEDARTAYTHYYLTDMSNLWRESHRDMVVQVPSYLFNDLFESDEFTKELKKRGYDGVLQSVFGDEAVAFKSSQIKSATDNNGDFSENPDIRYSVKDFGPHKFSITETPAFKDWFKGSKVVDENGNPLVVYRGAQFDPFAQEPGMGVIKPQRYFSPDKEYAEQYARNGGATRAYYLNLQSPLDIRNKKDYDVLASVFPAEVKPMAGHSGALDWANLTYFDIDEFIEQHPEYDGMVFDEGGAPVKDGIQWFGVSYMPFYGGAQVKSADNNNGEFSSENPDVRFSVAAASLYDQYENQDGQEFPWMSEDELISKIEEEIPYGLSTKALYAKIDEYRRLGEEDFEEGRRDFSGGEKEEVFNSILSTLRDMSNDQHYVRFSVTPEQDAEYMKAVEAGDMEKAQEMVNAAAIAAGYNYSGFHGSYYSGFTVFTNDHKWSDSPKDTFWFSSNKENAGSYKTDDEEGSLIKVFLKIQNPLIVDAQGLSWDQLPGYHEVYIEKENGDEIDESFETFEDALEFAVKNGGSREDVISAREGASTNEYARRAKARGYDGLIVKNVYDIFDDDGIDHKPADDYAVFSPSQIKSADPVVRDDEGNVVPLSKRFNEENEDIRFSVSRYSSFLKAQQEQKEPGKTYEDINESDVRFSLSKNNRATIETWLRKRKDLSDDERSAMMDYFDALESPMLQLASAKWFAHGTVILPEDMEKVEQAISVAGKAKVDPLQYNSPMELLNAHANFKPTEKRINPDDVPTLHKVKEFKDHGIVIYDVDNSQESRENMRKIINTHFGKDASPWCLLQGDKNGNLTDQSAMFWKHYNAYPKQVAFENGKLLAFSANDSRNVVWWDRQDAPNEGIPVERKMFGDELGRTATYTLDEDGILSNPHDIHRGNRQNGFYEKWHDDTGIQIVRYHYKDGKQDGIQERWHYGNGQLWIREEMKNGENIGEYEEYHADGTPEMIAHFDNEGRRQGEWIQYHDNGRPSVITHYVDNKQEGEVKAFDDNGKVLRSGQYKNNVKDGVWERYYTGGQLIARETYVDGEMDGLEEEWWPNGNKRAERHFDHGQERGARELWYESGNKRSHVEFGEYGLRNGEEIEYWDLAGGRNPVAHIMHWKNGKMDGVEEFYEADGQIIRRIHWQNNNRHGLYERWFPEGTIAERGNYVNGRPDGVWEWFSARDGRVIKREFYEKDKPAVELPIDDSGLDVRYSVVTDKDELERLEKQPTVTLYRAMEFVDGELLPPMSQKVPNSKGDKGKKLQRREGVVPGMWQKADEDPDKAYQKEPGGPWYYDLKKNSGSDVNGVLYNPYIHLSASPLNDQFSAASTRPNLVTVACEVPVGELAGKYKAEKANDSVGAKDWHSGTVTAQLGEGRQVVLSRWAKIGRIVPDSEVAAMVAPKLVEKNIGVPVNVVTPSLRKELEARGVKFIESEPASVKETPKIENPAPAPVEKAVEKEVVREDNETRFAVANANQEIFVSNAEIVAKSIPMQKATPEQWLKMLEKNGGLKSGEDKWLGLSDWLKQQQGTVTKQAVLDFIDQNKIIIEEVHYGETVENGLEELRLEFDEIYNSIIDGVGSEEGEDEVVMDPMEKAWDELNYRHHGGDDFNMAFELDDRGVIDVRDEDAAAHFLGGVKPIMNTRLDYTTSGLENKREIALTVPTVEPWNQYDKVHFGDAGEGRAVAWVRFGDAKRSADQTVVDEAKEKHTKADEAFNKLVRELKAKYNVNTYGDLLGEVAEEERAELRRLSDDSGNTLNDLDAIVSKRVGKVLFIDEIQSKRHQEGRERGYQIPEEEASKEWLDALHRYEDISREVNQQDIVTEEDSARLREARKAMDEARDAYNNNANAIPDAPFEKNWHELAMKRMLRLAAEEGYDYVAWTTGEQQAERYDIGNVVTAITRFDGNNYNFHFPSESSSLDITTNDEGTITKVIDNSLVFSHLEGKPLSEFVGKELATKMLSMDEHSELSDKDLRIGGEGMKAFYDGILVNFVNKYAKKWGVHVEDLTIPDVDIVDDGGGYGLTVHSIPVTQEMKDSVMEGQVMFSVRAANEAREEGIAGVIGAESVRDFYMGLYKQAPEEVCAVVADKAMDNGFDFVKAMAEYISDLAGKGYGNDETGLLMTAAGTLKYYAGDIDDKTAQYVLWRGQNPVDDDNLLDVAHDQFMRNRLGIGKPEDTPPDEPNGSGPGSRPEESVEDSIEQAREDTDTNPTDAQKKAGNYKHGHLTLDGYDISLENPKGSVRSGRDASGKEWSVTMNNDYGYIRMTEGVDGDHIDVFLSDNPEQGNVFVIDQVDPKTGAFDEHKVMYGFDSADEAAKAYLSNYSEGWKGLGTITEVTKDEFKKWIESSHRKTKPFSEYKSVNELGAQSGTLFSVKDELDTAEAAAEIAVEVAKDKQARDRKDIGDLMTAVKAMRSQREYDKKTVDAIANLAKTLLKDQYIDQMSRREISRLLGIVRTSVGRSPKAVRKNADAIVEVVLEHLLKREKAGLDVMLKTTGAKTNTTGVEVAGELDAQGQKTLKALKEGMKMELGDVDDSDDMNTLYGQRARLQERLDSKDDAVRKEAMAEDAGLALAIEYKENIEALLDEEGSLAVDLKELDAALKADELSKTAYYEAVEATMDAIRENKVDQVEAYREFRHKLQQMFSGSSEAKREFVKRDEERIGAIHHLANSDMQGKSASRDKAPAFKDKLANSSIVRFFAAPLASFDQMLRLFGSKSVEGRGYLFNKFMGDWQKASEDTYIGQRDAKEALDKKAREVFGDKEVNGVKIEHWDDLYRLERTMPKVTVKWWDDGKMTEHELTQGHLLYIYMVNKMADGRMKLRKMGIEQEHVDAIRKQMDKRFLKLADWMQDEYLVNLRNKYNEVHERLFGAPMAAIDNYFPLKINKRDLNRNEDIAAPDIDALPSTTTGSIIKRRRNSKALDLLNADAFSVMIEHIDQMEQWSAFAEFNKDLNALLSYKRFRNQVQNMASVYGSGTKLWTNFKDVARIAGNAYRPAVNSNQLDSAAVNLAKGVTFAKISFRVYTAMKQMLSMPAFVADANIAKLAANIATPWKAWKWAMDNLPLFEKRWKSRIAGDTRLMDTEVDWRFYRNELYQELSKLGMSPNAFVDAVTIAVGSHAVYETKYDQYMKEGFSAEEADKKAKQDATVLYNESQQSNEAAFLSPVQLDRTVFSTAITVFRNSSMGFQRQLHDALRNLEHMSRKGYKEESLAFMQKQLERQGLSTEQAKAAAEKRYNNALWHNAARVATFGFLVQFAWNLGGSLAYMLFGDDDDKKEEMLREAFVHALVGGSMEGLAGGNIISEALNMVAKGENLRNYDPTLLPIIADMKRTYAMMSYDPVAGCNELVNLAIQAGLGVNPQTLEDAVVGVIDACNGDLSTSREALLLTLRVLQVPQSQLDEIYIDELGMKAGDARKMSATQMAKRYADYKLMRGAGKFTPLYPDDMKEKRLDSYEKSFKKKVKARKELNKK